MSRLGFKPISLPKDVTIALDDNICTVKGPKGEVSVRVLPGVSVEAKDGLAHVHLAKEKAGTIEGEENHGTTAANLRNAVIGVSTGFKKELEIKGTGYRASVKGKTLTMFLGYTHEIAIDPIGQFTKISCPAETSVVVEGCDKQEVGQTAALIYDSHRPDVYGNKGVHYKGQHLIKKVGKRAAATATAGGKK